MFRNIFFEIHDGIIKKTKYTSFSSINLIPKTYFLLEGEGLYINKIQIPKTKGKNMDSIISNIMKNNYQFSENYSYYYKKDEEYEKVTSIIVYYFNCKKINDIKIRYLFRVKKILPIQMIILKKCEPFFEDKYLNSVIFCSYNGYLYILLIKNKNIIENYVFRQIEMDKALGTLNRLYNSNNDFKLILMNINKEVLNLDFEGIININTIDIKEMYKDIIHNEEVNFKYISLINKKYNLKSKVLWIFIALFIGLNIFNIFSIYNKKIMINKRNINISSESQKDNIVYNNMDYEALKKSIDLINILKNYKINYDLKIEENTINADISYINNGEDILLNIVNNIERKNDYEITDITSSKGEGENNSFIQISMKVKNSNEK